MIDFVILSKTDDERHFKMTSNLIKSLAETDYPADTSFDKYRITIVESSRNSTYLYPDCYDVVLFDYGKYGKFNYNYALNIGIEHCRKKYKDVEWICILNNDVVCKSDWIKEISRNYSEFPYVQSICANIRNWQPGVLFGHTLHRHVDGCCIMYRNELNDRLQLWDEKFDFLFQDDDYCELLKRYNIKHMRVLSSMICHYGSQTQFDGNDLSLAMKGAQVFIDKYSMEIFQLHECEKNMFIEWYKNTLKYI